MKLSLAWICDHIKTDWKKINIDALYAKFNEIVAEIEEVYEYNLDLKNFYACIIKKRENKIFQVFIPELKLDINLEKREDFVFKDSSFLLIKTGKSNDSFRWANLNDINLQKDGLIPALEIKSKDLSGNWRNIFETKDIIIEVDNKTITNRPDMWGHRGFAREIAAILNLKFIEKEKFLEKNKSLDFDSQTKKTKTNKIVIKNLAPKVCKRFSGIYIESFTNKACDPLIFSRLIKVGQRPINGIVDLSNYLTLDWSQPVHIYDADRIVGQEICSRMAKPEEELVLLDGSKLKLSKNDIVIADKEKALCLAGVMGGLYDSINHNTKKIFIESANFDAGTIRKSALNYKYRTESSSRFEKTLDPNQTTEGISRFLKLAKDFGFNISFAQEIVSAGKPVKPLILKVSHEFLEKKAGIELSSKNIINFLEKLEFKLNFKKDIYTIQVPTFRSSKDITIQEDIFEEVIRFYGYNNIKLNLPVIPTIPRDLDIVYKKRKIKNYFSYSLKMTEQQNYILLDENFTQKVGLLDKSVAGEIINPVSENLKKLNFSLLISLFKNITENYISYNNLRFFELAKVWHSGSKGEIIEKESLAGIIWQKDQDLDFYACKQEIENFFENFGFDRQDIIFSKKENNLDSWALKYQTADVLIKNNFVGTIGKVDPFFLSKLDLSCKSDAFYFELDANFLINYKLEDKKFSFISKYQDTFIDLSFIVPLTLKVKDLEKEFKNLNKLIFKVELIDFFARPEWQDQKSLTFRLHLSSPDKTLEKLEIDNIWQEAVKTASKFHAKLRE